MNTQLATQILNTVKTYGSQPVDTLIAKLDIDADTAFEAVMDMEIAGRLSVDFEHEDNTVSIPTPKPRVKNQQVWNIHGTTIHTTSYWDRTVEATYHGRVKTVTVNKKHVGASHAALECYTAITNHCDIDRLQPGQTLTIRTTGGYNGYIHRNR